MIWFSWDLSSQGNSLGISISEWIMRDDYVFRNMMTFDFYIRDWIYVIAWANNYCVSVPSRPRHTANCSVILIKIIITSKSYFNLYLAFQWICCSKLHECILIFYHQYVGELKSFYLIPYFWLYSSYNRSKFSNLQN